jgi:thiol-disulfide isomerase/thioredoxin
MKKLILSIIAVLSIGITNCQPKEGYEIHLIVKGLSDVDVLLAYHLGNKQYIKDSTRLDINGTGLFSGKTTLDQGVYIIILPDNNYFEFLVTEDQYFKIETTTSGMTEGVKFTGSAENTDFAEFQSAIASLYEKADLLRQRVNRNRQNPDSLKVLEALSVEHEAATRRLMLDAIDKHKGSFMASLIMAMQQVEVPVFDIPQVVSNIDSVRWIMNHNYNKDHFFDNFNLTDERLLRSPVFHPKIEHYFSNVVLQFPDSINRAIDKVLALAEGNKKTYQYIAVFLFNHFRESTIMGHDAVMVKIADAVYLSGKADWASQEFIDNLRKDIDRLRPSLIGNTGMDLTMTTLNHGVVTLHKLNREFIILYFWEPDCGHCKEMTPLLLDYYKRNRDKGIEVFSICTQPNRAIWEKYIEDNKLIWINGWDPDRSTHYDFFYNITATPTVYILDKDKKIIAKKLPVESVEGFIDSYRRQGR